MLTLNCLHKELILPIFCLNYLPSHWLGPCDLKQANLALLWAFLNMFVKQDVEKEATNQWGSRSLCWLCRTEMIFSTSRNSYISQSFSERLKKRTNNNNKKQQLRFSWTALCCVWLLAIQTQDRSQSNMYGKDTLLWIEALCIHWITSLVAAVTKTISPHGINRASICLPAVSLYAPHPLGGN